MSIERKLYPETWKRWKTKYYKKHRYADEARRRFTPEEDILILLHEKPDVELAKNIKRSVESIQIRRSRLMSESVNMYPEVLALVRQIKKEILKEIMNG